MVWSSSAWFQVGKEGHLEAHEGELPRQCGEEEEFVIGLGAEEHDNYFDEEEGTMNRRGRRRLQQIT